MRPHSGEQGLQSWGQKCWPLEWAHPAKLEAARAIEWQRPVPDFAVRSTVGWKLDVEKQDSSCQRLCVPRGLHDHRMGLNV